MRFALLFAFGCQSYVVLPPSPSPPAWRVESAGSEDLEGIWAASPDDVFAVGAHGTIVHSTDGATWTALASGTTVDLHAICGTGSAELYAVGDHQDDARVGPSRGGAVVLRSRDGATWERLPIGDELLHATSVWCGPDEVIVVGTYGDKSRYGFGGGPRTTRPTIDSAIAIPGQRNVIPAHAGCQLCDDGAVVVTRDHGASWTGGMTLRMEYPRDVVAVGDDVWVTGVPSTLFAGYALRSRDRGATFEPMPGGSSPASVSDFITGRFNAIWARGSDDVYVVGGSGLLYHDGERPTGLGRLAAVWGTRDELFVAGDHGTLARVRETIEPIPLATQRDLAAIWGLDDDHVYAVGARGTVVRYE
jgi:photosystem II stability/assembly factor-like uncharacterized protein